MSEKKQAGGEKKGSNRHVSESEGASSLQSSASRKRKAERTVDREPSALRAGHKQHVARQEHRPDLIPPHASLMEDQQQRHSQMLHPSMSVHHPRRPGVPHSPTRARSRRHTMPTPQRTMLEQAWHTVMNSDPLIDSDEECPDEHLRLDYSRRMQVISRLRGRPPSPEGRLSADAPLAGAARRRPSLT